MTLLVLLIPLILTSLLFRSKRNKFPPWKQCFRIKKLNSGSNFKISNIICQRTPEIHLLMSKWQQGLWQLKIYLNRNRLLKTLFHSLVHGCFQLKYYKIVSLYFMKILFLNLINSSRICNSIWNNWKRKWIKMMQNWLI